MIEVPAICGLCPHGCWIRAHVSDGELIAVARDPHPLYGGLCERGKRFSRTVYSEERITTPLVRTGPKGTLSFKTTGWEEALDAVAAGFRKIAEKHGPRAVASYMGAGTLEDSLSDFYKTILSPMGSPNDIDCGSICYVASHIIAPVTTLGIEGDALTPDVERADLIILWGTNPHKDGLPERMSRIRAARARGARLIVVDPRRHHLAKTADLWVPVKPGTDGVLIMALINIMIADRSYDSQFVADWSVGFTELAQCAASFTPPRAADLCGIDTKAIQTLAEMITSSSRVCFDFFSGLEFATSGVQNVRALYSLQALAGSIDRDGGLYIHAYPHEPHVEHSFDEASPPLGAREYPVFHALTGRAHMSALPRAVLRDDPYPVRALLLVGASPSLSYPIDGTWSEVYGALDFMTVVDRFLPEEALWADVILPAATYYEIDSYHVYRNLVRRRRKIIEPVGQARNDALILAAISERLGYPYAVPQSEEEVVERFLRDRLKIGRVGTLPDVASLPIPPRRTRKYETGHLRSDGKSGFPTPSGKFEFVSGLLSRHGYDQLPVYMHHEAAGSLPLDLVLTTGARTRTRFNSHHAGSSCMSADREEAVLDIHPYDASTRNIKDGDTIMLTTQRGAVTLQAHVTKDIARGVVHAPLPGGREGKLFGQRCGQVNRVMPSELCDPISGYPAVKAVPCCVSTVRLAKRTLHPSEAQPS